MWETASRPPSYSSRVCDHPAEQLQLPVGHPLEHEFKHLVDIGACIDQSCRQPKRGRAGGAVLKLSGVGHEADVQRFGDLLRDLDPESVEDPGQDLGGGGCAAVHQVDRAEPAVVVVVVDVDHDGGRLQNLREVGADPAFVAAVHREHRPTLNRGRIDLALQALGIEETHLFWDRRVGVDVRPHLHPAVAQSGRGGGHRADGVAVRILVGRDQHAVSGRECGDHLIEVVLQTGIRHWESSAAGRSCARRSSSRRARSRLSS